MNIVVLAGGLSPERDVSLSSGVMAANALLSRGHRAVLVDLFFGLELPAGGAEEVFLRAAPLEPRPVPAAAPALDAVRAGRKSGFSPDIGNGVIELCRAADIVYLALHGDDGENGKLQAFFDLLGIRYTGSPSFGCALAMNKWIAKQLFGHAGILTPHGVHLRRGQDGMQDLIGLPCVVKPCCGGSSLGISIARTAAERAAALEEAFRYEDEVLVEEYIPGRELSCGVLGGEALPLIEIIPLESFYDYAHKYQAGLTEEITPARLEPELTQQIQAAAVQACRALRIEIYARVDFLLSAAGRVYCLEANTLPGMTPTSLLPQEAAAAGIDYPALCEKIITLSMRKYQ
ncbi:MAG: D-alanine--D-alanine ligase [Clostridia bacterium]|nr:D-alanine--D-alanine ligase [Clostridia bacterium]